MHFPKAIIRNFNLNAVLNKIDFIDKEVILFNCTFMHQMRYATCITWVPEKHSNFYNMYYLGA